MAVEVCTPSRHRSIIRYSECVSSASEYSHIAGRYFRRDTRYLYSLNFEFDISVLRPAVEFRVPIDVVHGSDVVCDQG